MTCGSNCYHLRHQRVRSLISKSANCANNSRSTVSFIRVYTIDLALSYYCDHTSHHAATKNTITRSLPYHPRNGSQQPSTLLQTRSQTTIPPNNLHQTCLARSSRSSQWAQRQRRSSSRRKESKSRIRNTRQHNI